MVCEVYIQFYKLFLAGHETATSSSHETDERREFQFPEVEEGKRQRSAETTGKGELILKLRFVTRQILCPRDLIRLAENCV